jgi:TRAP-type mannitol/chloroaromatic compound transport system permease large subunit
MVRHRIGLHGIYNIIGGNEFVQGLLECLDLPPLGVIFVMNIQIYFLSPTFGPACFWLKSVAPPEITLQDIFLAVLPFFGLQLIGLTLVIIFPEIVMFLPNLMSG